MLAWAAARINPVHKQGFSTGFAMDFVLSRAFNSGNKKVFVRRLLTLGQSFAGCLFEPNVVGEMYQDFALEALREYCRTRSGQVYVAAHPLLPQLHKIGQTGIDAARRIASLRTAGVPGHFVLLHAQPTTDRFEAERLAHQALGARRADREFFAVNFTQAIEAVIAAAQAADTRLANAWRVAGLAS